MIPVMTVVIFIFAEVYVAVSSLITLKMGFASSLWSILSSFP